jgi:amidase
MQEFTILELSDKMRSGELTCYRIVSNYLDLIRVYDPPLRSVIEINPEAFEIAKNLDAERAAGKTRGPLHGIPILLKENIDTADQMQTTSGSLALEGNIALRDAFLVEQLRKAGALILGKTNLSEWANFRSTKSSSGWSSRGGQCRNPYALDRSPCGSSSGSGVAVASNFCAAAIGTETDGSIVCPSQTNGIVGIKPTLGLVSRSGIIPIAHSQDTAGPMARTVSDAAILLGCLTGLDERDAATGASVGRVETDYTRFLDKDGLKGARIGISRNFVGKDKRVEKIFEHAIAVIKNLGAEIVDPANVDNESKYSKTELEVLLYEFKADLNAYLTEHPSAPRRSMAEITAHNEQNKTRIMPFFGQERMEQAQKKGNLTTKKYLAALEKNQRLSREGIDLLMAKHHLDALIAPTGCPAWMIDLINGDQYPGGGFSTAAAVAGYPHITVPMGYIYGLPVGLSLFGAAWTEGKLIQYAYAFEQATKARKMPQFLPTLDFSAPEVSW